MLGRAQTHPLFVLAAVLSMSCALVPRAPQPSPEAPEGAEGIVLAESVEASTAGEPSQPDEEPCPPLPPPQYLSGLASYRAELEEWLGKERAAVDAIAKTPFERRTDEGVKHESRDQAEWLLEQLRHRLIVPTAQRVWHPELRTLLTTIQAHPWRRARGPLVRIGAMGGHLYFPECEASPPRNEQACDKYRAAYSLLDYLANSLSPTFRWEGYRPPDFEAGPDSAESGRAETSDEQDSEGPPERVCPDPVVPVEKNKWRFTSVFDKAVDAGARRENVQKLALELFGELSERAERSGQAPAREGTHGAFLLAAFRTFSAAETRKLSVLSERGHTRPAASVIVDLMAREFTQGTVGYDELIHAEQTNHTTCGTKYWGEFIRCAATFSLSEACPRKPGPATARCLTRVHARHGLAATLFVIRDGADAHVQAQALTDLFEREAAAPGGRSRTVARVTKLYDDLFVKPWPGEPPQQ